MRSLSILWVLMETPVTNAPFRYLVGELGKRHTASLCTYFRAGGMIYDPSRRLAGVFEGNGTVFGFMRAATRALRARDVDVVSVHLPHLALLLVPLLVLFQGFDWRKSSVYVVHNSFPAVRARNKIFTVLALAAYRHIVVCGDAAARSLPRPVRALAGSHLVVIPNGADLAGVDSASPTPAKEGRFTVVSAARLEPVKRMEDAISAFAEADIDDSRLVLIGDGSQRQRLETLAGSLARGKVTFTGMVPREEVYALLATSDCYLSTSSSEGMPVAVLEAMAAGLPLVLSDIPPHREITDGTGARFADVGDSEAFAVALRDLAALVPEERAELGRALRKHVAANYSLDAYLEAYEYLYLSVAG